jgi:hypothetical protein
MDELVQFVRDRLDEDEVLALATTPVPVTGRWRASRDKHADRDASLTIIQGADDVDPGSQEYSSDVPVIAYAAEWHDEAEANLRHIARHDPARVLTGIEAKRRLVDDMAKIVGGDYIDDGEPVLAEWVLLLLALPYAAHPDYREEWRP